MTTQQLDHDNQFDHDLIALAAAWPVDDAGDGPRCGQCEQRVYVELYGPTRAALVHLLHAHGYRMNGNQYDNENRIIGCASDAKGALAQ